LAPVGDSPPRFEGNGTESINGVARVHAEGGWARTAGLNEARDIDKGDAEAAKVIPGGIVSSEGTARSGALGIAPAAGAQMVRMHAIWTEFRTAQYRENPGA
jgi:hypothetical protein